MTIRISKTDTGERLLEKVEERSGVDLSACLQCKRCANGCPVAGFTDSTPAEIIRRLQLGAGTDLLDSEIIWTCASCETCYGRCPMQINGAALMDALRMLAAEEKAAKPAGNIPLMNRLLLATMKTFGRTYDLGAMALYKAGTGSFLRDTGKFPMILRKGKMALLPPRGADTTTVKRIFKKFMKARNK